MSLISARKFRSVTLAAAVVLVASSCSQTDQAVTSEDSVVAEQDKPVASTESSESPAPESAPSESSDEDSDEAATTSSDTAAVASVLPTADVITIATGETAPFNQTIGTENEQVLLWFYFPH